MRPAVARALAVVAAFFAIYVAYAHAAQWRLAREYLEEPIALRFDGNAWSRGLDVASAGGFEVAPEAGALRVRGATSDPSGALSRVEIRAPRRRLRDVAARLRFRVASPADVDVGIALARDGEPPREIGFGVRDFAGDEGAAWRTFGDESAAPPATGDAMGKQRFVPFDRPRDEHEIELRMSADLHLAMGSVDGAPVASHLAFWDDGEPVRLVVFVRARSTGQRVDVAIVQADYAPIVPDTRRRSVDDRFDGKVVDSSVWRVVQPDGFDVEGSVSLVPGGLALRGHALRPLVERPGSWLAMESRALGSFRATLRFEMPELHRARVHFGVSNRLFGLPEWRAFEIGLADHDAQVEPFVAGHWNGDQRFDFSPQPPVTLGASHAELAIDYDARTRVATATLDGRPLLTRRLDLLPPEDVTISFGVRAIDGESRYDVRFTSFTFEARP